jgi:large subunit ribosomal protein L22
MDFISTKKFVITTPRKLREVVELIKDMTPKDAVERLPYIQRRAAGPLRKAILTAIANAKQKEINVEDLSFKEVQIGEGPKMKRWRAGARGRAKPYAKRMSHIRVVLEGKEKAKKAPKATKSKAKAGKKETAAKKEKKTADKKKGAKKK